jgi:phosphinothricin acetyltransferase
MTPRPVDDSLRVRTAVEADAASLAEIYNYFVINAISTFEETPVTSTAMSARLGDSAAAELPWLVAERDGEVIGYAYASAWKSRRAYRFSAEITAYVRHGMEGCGVGSQLYRELFPLLAARGFHAVLAGIALPNEASIGLHEKLGMTQVAQLRDVGFKFGKWIDVGYWERVLPGP